MQVKYIVYYPGHNKPPKVALWLTSDGSMIHKKYAEEHNISPHSYSSLGYIYYWPESGKYRLEHYPRKEANTLLEFIEQKKTELRDRKLVLKEIAQNPIFKNPRIQHGTYQDWILWQRKQQQALRTV